MYLTKEATDKGIEIENIGVGRILWVPVPMWNADEMTADLQGRLAYIYGRTLRAHQQKGSAGFIAKLSSMGSVLGHYGGHLRYKTAILSETLTHMLRTQDIDLLAFHWLSYDTGALTEHAVKAGVPFVYINHFDNKRLSLPVTRKCIPRAAGIASVSDHGIPPELSERCVNVSDAVDTGFFTPDKARPVGLPAGPIVLLPARFQEGKGHLDLIRAASILIARKVDLVLCFTGAVDSESLHRELCSAAGAGNLDGRIVFFGEAGTEEMRDCFARSSVVALPSYSEGLPRVLLEAQAMRKPVVAYDRGGTSKAFQPNETGFLVEAGNVEDLADRIGFLLENESIRLRMGKRGREFVSRQFSVSALIHRHENFYLNALAGVRV
jgi:glycosyltransferase involved in cell wall biosynthesis